MKNLFKKAAVIALTIALTLVLAVSASAAAGDLDGNGEVNKDDAIYLLMHTFFETDYPITGNVDYNKDGDVNKDDAIYLLMHTFFEEEYPLECSHNYENGVCTNCGEYEPTPDEYFVFTELSDGTYSIAAKDVADMPAVVVIPSEHNEKAVTAIADEGFRNCDLLEKVIVPESVVSIGDYAFYDCDILVSTTISGRELGFFAISTSVNSSIEIIPEGTVVIGDSAYAGCENLEIVIIPDSVTSIGNNAFEGCSSLASVNIPENVESIGDSAFASCSSLESITIPESVTSIGASAFEGCESLTEIYYTGTPEQWESIENDPSNEIFDNASVHFGCKHDYKDGVCTKCGEQQPSHVHNEVIDEAVEPTCTETGLTEGKHCDRCGEVIVAQETIPALGHTYSAVVTAPTCTAKGYTTYTCHCGDSYVADEVAALGHDEVIDGAVGATCTETGLAEGKHCDRCGETLVAQEIVPALGHNEVIDEAIEPTCTIAGFTEGKYCDRCGETFVAQEIIPSLGHNEVIDEAVGATCTETGLSEGRHCDRCGEILIGQAIFSALGHDEVIDEAVSPTCTETGLTEGKHCDRCGEVFFAQEIVSVLGHNEVISEAVSPTCTETGLTEGKHCDRCNAVLVAQETVPALGHTHNAVVTAPACATDGYTTYTCHCGDSYVADEIPALGHDEVTDEAVGATCTEPGLTEGKHCDRCGEVLVPQETVSALGHNFENGACSICATGDPNFLSNQILIDRGNDDYAYRYFGTLADGENLQKFYRAIDSIATPFYLDYDSNISSDLLIAKVNYHNYGLTTSEAISVWNMYRNDHPLYYWMSATISWTETELLLFVDELYTDAVVRQKYNQLILSKVKDFLSITSNETSAYQIALAYHDTIIQTVDYVFEDNGVTPEENAWAHNILGVFENGKGVCESYARTFQLLLNLKGVENIFVSGTSNDQNHAWNLVKMDDGQWYWFDLTWDDTPNWMWGISYNYFCVNDSQNVNWKDGGWETNEKSFLDTHKYASSTGEDVDFLYSLPNRAEAQYSDNQTLKKRFTIDGNSYVIVGYHALQLTRAENEGVSNIPETVVYSNTPYTVIAIGCISTSGYLGASDTWDDPVVFADTVEQVYIPKTVKFIWDNAFRSLGLKEIVVDEQNPHFESCEGVLFTKDLTVLISYPRKKTAEKFYIPDQTIMIANHAFEDCLLKEVTIGKSVEAFGFVNWGLGWTLDRTIYVVGNPLSPQFGNSYYMDLLIKVSPEHPYYKVIDHGIYWGTTFVGLDCLFGPPRLEIVSGTTSILSFKSYGVVEIIIPESIESIEDVSFKNCFGRVEICNNAQIDISPSVAKHVYSSTSGSSKLIYKDEYILYKDGDTLSLVLYIGNKKGDSSSTSFSVPDGVTNIGSYAFYHCDELTSVVIPDSVTTVGEYSFALCSNLNNITLSNGIISIEPGTFYKCQNLTTVVIPDNVTNIGVYAFKSCSNLISVTLGKGVTSIGAEAFIECYKLVEIVNHSALPITAKSTGYGWVAYYARGVHSGTSRIIIQDGHYLYVYDDVCALVGVASEGETFVISNGVTDIGDYVFYGYSNLKSIVIPDSVRDIGDYAFFGCTSLTSIAIPSNVTSIGDSAFENCSNLSGIYIENLEAWLNINFYVGENPLKYLHNLYVNGELVTHLDIPNGVTSIKASAFEGCTSLISVTISESVEKIELGAFSNCTSLLSVAIPNGLTCIDAEAFENCTSLISMAIPDSVTSIGFDAFKGCTKLIEIVNGVHYVGNWVMDCDMTVANVTIRKNTRGIASYAFSDCIHLTSIVISEGIKEIPLCAFQNCTALTSIVIPNSVIKIDSWAFRGCTSLIEKANGVHYVENWVIDCDTSVTSVCIRNNMRGIADEAFENCINLTDIIIPDSVEIISERAFNNCKSLTSVTIGNGVTSIGNRAFYRCTSLASIIIPNSVTSIGEYAFASCVSLASITIPDSVTSIGEFAFFDCYALKDVYYTGTPEQWSSITIGLLNNPLKNATIHYNHGK